MHRPATQRRSEMASSMLVAVRVRPITQEEQQEGHRGCCRVIGNQTILIERNGQPQHHLKSQQRSEREYAFDFAFDPMATQDELYAKTVESIIPTILDGFDATIFAYGATGAGKTHTMMGSDRDGIEPSYSVTQTPTRLSVDGIIPHALADIYDLINARSAAEEELRLQDGTVSEWKVLISYLEVYNEQIRDLLLPSDTPLVLREDTAKGTVQVAGLHYEEASSAEDVLTLLRRGNRHRKTEPTAANRLSSRSHAVIQVLVQHRQTQLVSSAQPAQTLREGRLSLIDLAGSERASATKNRGMRLTEGANINKSLLALANCINSLSLRQNTRTRNARTPGTSSSNLRKRAHYRDSKLTHLLKNSLEGDCRLVMIANINPSHTCYEETHNTLKYANRAKNIKTRPRMHVMTAEMSYQQQISRLEAENEALRKALAESQRQEQSAESIARPCPRKRRYTSFVYGTPTNKTCASSLQSPTGVELLAESPQSEEIGLGSSVRDPLGEEQIPTLELSTSETGYMQSSPSLTNGTSMIPRPRRVSVSSRESIGSLIEEADSISASREKSRQTSTETAASDKRSSVEWSTGLRTPSPSYKSRYSGLYRSSEAKDSLQSSQLLRPKSYHRKYTSL